MMRFDTYSLIKYAPVDVPEVEVLQQLPCGLHRAELAEAYDLLPELWDLYNSAPVENPEDWEVDVKIHMLMPNQYPCIPNWHCDNVPRVDGQTRFDLVEDGVEPMLLWISGTPCTEFLSHSIEADLIPANHRELSMLIQGRLDLETTTIPPQHWISMNQLTPHRGCISTRNQWRVFIRLTHKSITSARPVVSKIRRHAQVYLSADTFSW